MSKIYDSLNDLIDRIFGREITHTLMTNTGRKIRCAESMELFDSENKIYVGKCLENLRYNIITINSDQVEYISEKFDEETWSMICGINPLDTNADDENISRFYG